MKKKFLKVASLALGISLALGATASAAEPFRSEKDIALFASTDERFLEKSLLADPAEMGDAKAFRIPSLLNTGEALIAAVDMGASSADWGDINVAIRRSLDQGKTWSSPPEIILSGPQREANFDNSSRPAAFYIDPLMVKASSGDVIMMIDFWPESSGLHDRTIVEKNLDAYVTVDGKSYLALYAGNSKLDKLTSAPGDPYTVRENGWIFTPSGEKTNYYIPQNNSSESGYETIGDMYFAVGEPDYILETPPMIPEKPEGDKDVYVGNIFLSKGKPEFSLADPVFVQKKNVGNSQETGKTYDAEGDYECTTTSPAPLRVAIKSYLYVTRSSDNGVTWSKPVDITASVMTKEDGFFLGTAPGVGLTLANQKDESKNGRILMPVYALGSSVCLFSDDNGMTWERSPGYVNNVDEWQMIEMPDGTLMSFGRQTGYDITPVSYSTDGGENWSKREYTGLMSVKCQKSVIAYPISGEALPAQLDKTKQYVLASHPSGSQSNKSSRDNGVISLGVVEEGNKIRWLYERKLLLDGQYDMLEKNKTFFAYSCMAVLNDGTVGVFYEAQPGNYLTYTNFNLEWVMAGEQLEEVNAKMPASTKKVILIVSLSVGGGVLLIAGIAAIVAKKKKKGA